MSHSWGGAYSRLAEAEEAHLFTDGHDHVLALARVREYSPAQGWS